jgi:stearoyl-CoA desaturase (delta-9 desaturase)
MSLIIVFIIFWYASLFCQTFFQHRYSAHGAFKMSRRWEKVFFILTWITQGPSYLSPRTYAIMHRMHHAYTDTSLDPHSPSYSKNVFDMMWKTRKIYSNIFNGHLEIEPRFLNNLPDWRRFDKIAHSTISRLVWAIVYMLVFIWLVPNPWFWFLFPFALILGPLHGAIINWYAHKYGYNKFKLRNTAHNLMHVDILMLGESYHNNHHRSPASINFGRRWHEIDPGYLIIKFLAWAKIVKFNK